MAADRAHSPDMLTHALDQLREALGVLALADADTTQSDVSMALRMSVSAVNALALVCRSTNEKVRPAGDVRAALKNVFTASSSLVTVYTAPDDDDPDVQAASATEEAGDTNGQ